MSNNIVFQHSAGELKSAIYGYDGTKYEPLNVDSNGNLNVNASIVSGTINVQIGTLGTVQQLNSIKNGTVHVQTGTLGVVQQLNSIRNGTVHVQTGTLRVIQQLSSMRNGTVHVQTGTLGVVQQLNSIVNGTIQVKSGTVLAQGFDGTSNQKIKVDTTGQLMVGLYDRKFTEVSETIIQISTAGEFGTVIDTSKYQDYSWYINRLSSSVGNTINVQLAVAPTHTANYALIGESGTVIGGTAQVITNDYYLHYTKLKVWTPSRTATVQVWFNGRY